MQIAKTSNTFFDVFGGISFGKEEFYLARKSFQKVEFFKKVSFHQKNTKKCTESYGIKEMVIPQVKKSFHQSSMNFQETQFTGASKLSLSSTILENRIVRIEFLLFTWDIGFFSVNI